jgi:putative glycerol kinase 5
LTSKAHIVRAVLEAIAFRVLQMHKILQSNFNSEIQCIRANGGISNNDFIIQLISDLTNCQVERAENREMSTLGVTFLAGLSAGVWKNLDELTELRKVENIFKPETKNLNHYKDEFVGWQRAVDRCLRWYNIS